MAAVRWTASRLLNRRIVMNMNQALTKYGLGKLKFPYWIHGYGVTTQKIPVWLPIISKNVRWFNFVFKNKAIIVQKGLKNQKLKPVWGLPVTVMTRDKSKSPINYDLLSDKYCLVYCDKSKSLSIHEVISTLAMVTNLPNTDRDISWLPCFATTVEEARKKAEEYAEKANKEPQQ
jgi:hypothetical protein